MKQINNTYDISTANYVLKYFLVLVLDNHKWKDKISQRQPKLVQDCISSTCILAEEAGATTGRPFIL